MKVIVGIAVGILIIIAMRVAVNFLAAPSAPVLESIEELANELELTPADLPLSEWQQQAPVQDERLDPGYKPKPEKHIVMQELEKPSLNVDSNAKKKPDVIQATDEKSLTPEQIFPEVGALFSDEFEGDKEQRRLELARFVQSVEPSITEICLLYTSDAADE